MHVYRELKEVFLLCAAVLSHKEGRMRTISDGHNLVDVAQRSSSQCDERESSLALNALDVSRATSDLVGHKNAQLYYSMVLHCPPCVVKAACLFDC